MLTEQQKEKILRQLPKNNAHSTKLINDECRNYVYNTTRLMLPESSNTCSQHNAALEHT